MIRYSLVTLQKINDIEINVVLYYYPDPKMIHNGINIQTFSKID
jgi:hypothetical protein